jgi:DNA-binding GntR family transcriptional regulator
MSAPVISPLARDTVAAATLKVARELILSGSLREGEAVRQEWLSERLGVSRIPVREALRQLEAEGLVTFTPHKGAVVSTLSLEEITELFDLRALIERDLLQRSVPRMTAADLIGAREILKRFNAAFRRGDIGVWGQFNWEFHSALYGPAGRQRSMGIAQNLHQHTDRYSRMQLALTQGQHQAAREHAKLLALCEERDTKGACALLKKHILGAGERLVTLLRERQAPAIRS